MRTCRLILCMTLALSANAAAQNNAPIAQSPAGGDAAEVARLNEQIVELYKQRKFDEALTLTERALGIAERVAGPEGRLVADVLANHAEVMLAKEEYGRAEAAVRRGLAIQEKASGPDSPQVLGALTRLAVVQFRRGDHSQAEGTVRRVIEIAEGKHGAQSVEAARAWVTLAEMQRVRGSGGKAQEAYERVLAVAERINPASIPGQITLGLANYLGLLYARGKGDDETVARINKVIISVGAALSAKNPQVVQGGILNGKAVYKPAPHYPPEARAAREQGPVSVRIVVDETGKVVEAEGDASAPFHIRHAAEQAALRARFTPTLLSGVPVKVAGRITYNFTLR